MRAPPLATWPWPLLPTVIAADRPMLVSSGLAPPNGETAVEEGSVLFVPAGQALRFAAGPDADAQVFVACCNDGFFA